MRSIVVFLKKMAQLWNQDLLMFIQHTYNHDIRAHMASTTKRKGP